MSVFALLAQACLAGSLAQVPLDANPQTTCPGPTPDLNCDRHRQAGWPRAVAWWAIPSESCAYTVYQAGGGCPCPRLSDPPRSSEGTWGWDYVGHWFQRHVILGWWHERSEQGGTYQTDVRADR
jgi:hypothetical protein